MEEKESSDSGADELVGRVIDEKYRLDERIGHGGMGAVYRATHVLMDRTVAVKLLHRHLVEGSVQKEELLGRFRREAKTQASIEHPHAVAIHDYGIFENAPYLVMQFVEGVSLKSLLKREGPLARERVLPFLIEVGEAIHEAHRRGIVHRDIKPDNIMITEGLDGGERALITDFGIAKILTADGGAEADGGEQGAGGASPMLNATGTDITQAGNVVGTPNYISPEQIKGEALDARSDVYSMGVILYEVCTGQAPFSAETAVSVMMKHMSETPPPIKAAAPERKVPPALEQVIFKALSKDPAQRQQDMQELIREIREAVPHECRVERRRRLPAALLGGAAVVIGLAVFAAVRFFPGLLPRQDGSPSAGEQTGGAAGTELAPERAREQWPLVRRSIDDAVEKANSIAEAAVKTARYNQRIASLSSPSRRELFERLRDKSLEEARELVRGYRRELASLAALTDAAALGENKEKYLREQGVSATVIPNRAKLVDVLARHLESEGSAEKLSDEAVFADALRAADPAALEELQGNFDGFCSLCENTP